MVNGSPTYLTRDPDDIVTIASLLKILGVLLFALVLSGCVNMFLIFRNASVIIRSLILKIIVWCDSVDFNESFKQFCDSQ